MPWTDSDDSSFSDFSSDSGDDYQELFAAARQRSDYLEKQRRGEEENSSDDDADDDEADLRAAGGLRIGDDGEEGEEVPGDDTDRTEEPLLRSDGKTVSTTSVELQKEFKETGGVASSGLDGGTGEGYSLVNLFDDQNRKYVRAGDDGNAEGGGSDSGGSDDSGTTLDVPKYVPKWKKRQLAKIAERKEARRLELEEKRRKEFEEAVQPFYDGEYRVTELTGELWAADLLLIIFLYLIPEKKTLCATAAVCRAWRERISLVPQWRWCPLPMRINLSGRQITKWLAQQSADTLVKTKSSAVRDKKTYLEAIQFKVVRIEQERLLKRRERRDFATKRFYVSSAYIFLMGAVVALLLWMAIGIAAYQKGGLSTYTQSSVAYWFFALILGFFACVIIHARCGDGASYESIWKSKGGKRSQFGLWALMANATIIVMILGTVLNLVYYREVAIDKNIATVTGIGGLYVDIPFCEFKAPSSEEQPVVYRLPFSYNLQQNNADGDESSSSTPETKQDSWTNSTTYETLSNGTSTTLIATETFYGYTYNYSQPQLSYNGTNFSLLTSYLYREAWRENHTDNTGGGGGDDQKAITFPTGYELLVKGGCASTCYCSLAIHGNVQKPGWWGNMTRESFDANETLLIRSYRPVGQFVGSPPMPDVKLITLNAFLWHTYNVPMIPFPPLVEETSTTGGVTDPKTGKLETLTDFTPQRSLSSISDDQNPQVQLDKWTKVRWTVIYVILGFFALGCVPFCLGGKSCAENQLIFWVVLCLLIFNCGQMTLWGALCYWDSSNSVCLISPTSSLVVFIMGATLTVGAISQVLEDNCCD